MVASALPRPEKAEKPAPSTIALRPGVIRVALTVSSAPTWAYTLPVDGHHAEPDNAPSGKRVRSGIRDVCFGSAIFATHRLVAVRRKDVSFEGKQRDKFIFTLVPAEDYKEPKDPAFIAAAFASLSEFFVREAFNEAIIFDNEEFGMLVEFRGQARRQNANKSFVIG